MKIIKIDLYSLGDYAKHLKSLKEEDKYSRFGTNMSDTSIDQLMLRMVYNPEDHELWAALDNSDNVCGFGHMAYDGKSWELAVSVDASAQRRGIGNKLIQEMLEWAKFHGIDEVFMHCIENNKVIQHLASKNKLKTKERGFGERVAAIELADPDFFEKNNQIFKEYTRLVDEMTELRLRVLNLMLGNTDTSHKEK
jgi:GNAT superfamily N-acetyltransferase